MTNLRRLYLLITLISILSVPVLAGERSSPPCAPGETSSPPCAAAQVTPDGSVAPGQTDTPPASNAAVTPSVAEIAVDLLQSVLSLF